jgi:hypothetical protein
MARNAPSVPGQNPSNKQWKENETMKKAKKMEKKTAKKGK